MEITLISLSVCIAAYVAYIVKDGIPQSLSATYYQLGGDGWLFQMLMCLCAFGLLPVWLEVSDDAWSFLPFLGCGSLLFVAASPCFRLPLDGSVHYGSAIVCGVSVVLWQLLEGLWDWLLFTSLIGWMGYLRYSKYMWWLECVLVSSLIGNLLRLV